MRDGYEPDLWVWETSSQSHFCSDCPVYARLRQGSGPQMPVMEFYRRSCLFLKNAPGKFTGGKLKIGTIFLMIAQLVIQRTKSEKIG